MDEDTGLFEFLCRNEERWVLINEVLASLKLSNYVSGRLSVNV